MDSNSFSIYIVDAFTTKAFGGNAAGVVVIPYENALNDETMQSIASELNKPMTAFIKPTLSESPCARYSLLWFNPKQKAKFCGHATLAAGHVLFNELNLPFSTITMDSPVGDVDISRSSASLSLSFPLSPLEYVETPTEHHQALLHSLVSHEQLAGRKVEYYYSAAINDVLVHIESMGADELAELVYCHSAATERAGSALGVRAVVFVSGGNDGEYDSVARVFGIENGGEEDQVTGSAHTAIAALFGKDRIRARQCSQRGGDLLIERKGDRVLITGDSVTIVRGTMSI
ncbi:hypothetical protein GGI05_004806 [Coemansia sp. RSA 2603]|nr:hypothetical protein GGI05_004806 [Coemansia sp. RSA 2603]